MSISLHAYVACAALTDYGQNTKIRETLSNLILKSPQEWQTNVALPFVKIEGTTVEWDECAARRCLRTAIQGGAAPRSRPVPCLAGFTSTCACSSACRTRACLACRPRSAAVTAIASCAAECARCPSNHLLVFAPTFDADSLRFVSAVA